MDRGVKDEALKVWRQAKATISEAFFLVAISTSEDAGDLKIKVRDELKDLEKNEISLAGHIHQTIVEKAQAALMHKVTAPLARRKTKKF